MSELKTIIDANIKENGNQEITGKTLNYVLNKVAEGTQKDWNESDATNVEYIKGRTHGVTYEHVSVEGTLKELGYVPGEYVSVLHYARVNGVLEGKGLYLGGLLYNPIVGEEYRAKYEGPSVYARVVEVEDGYDVQIKGSSATGNLLKVAIVEYKKIDDAYISTDIARKSQVDALEDKVDNLPQGDKFDKQGNYPLLHVGTADDLAGRGESVPAEFGFRASGGKSIKDGRAYIKRIKGNSVVWNQLITNSSEVVTSNKVRAFNNGTSIVAGHKYLLLAKFNGAEKAAEISIYTRVDGTNVLIKSLSNINEQPYLFFTSAYSGVSDGTANTNEGNIWQYFYFMGTSESITDTHLIDLTKAFPNDWQNINTIEDFNARVATLGVDLNAYNEGQVIHCNTESIKSVGDNAWDEEWELGRIDNTNGELVSATTMIRSKNAIRVIPGSTYYYNIPNVANGSYMGFATFYDNTNTFVSYKPIAGTAYMNVVTPSNAKYMRFYLRAGYGTTYNNDIMITLVHSGWKQDTDAGYQPYWQDTLPLPIIRKYFPNGMKSAGTAHDEIRYNKASGKWEHSKGKIKSVDMGTLNWGLTSQMYFRANLPSDSIIPTSVNYNGFLCAKYERVNFNLIYGQSVTTPCFGVSANNGMIGVYDSSYTDAASFKSAMAGVILYYEAAEWEWEELDAEDQNFRDYYQVADFGTEQSQSEVPSAPFSADIIYQFNAVDMIREHELEITELQKVIATMQAQLASLANI